MKEFSVKLKIKTKTIVYTRNPSKVDEKCQIQKTMKIEIVRCFSENEHQFFFKSADFDVVFFYEIAKKNTQTHY